VTEVSLTLPDDYDVNYWHIMIVYLFYFECKAGFSPIGSANIQKTFQINPPLLSWTGEDNYHFGGVYPSSGQTDTTFEFRVHYQYVPSDSDVGTSYPDAELWIDFNQDGEYEYEDNETFDLTPEIDGNYAEGKIFFHTLKGWHREGSYNYRFYFQHIKGGLAVGEPTKDHSFTIYVPREKGWTTYTTADGLASNHIKCLVAQGNTLWVGTEDAGLNKYSDNSGFETVSQSDVASPFIQDMVLDSTSDVLYVGTLYLGLYSFSDSSWKLYTKEDTNVFEKQYIHIPYLAFDKNNHRVWMVAYQMSERETEEDIQKELDPNSVEISLICYDVSEISWTKYTKEEISSHVGGGLPGQNICDLAVDDNGNVWVSTFTSTSPSSEDEAGEFEPKGLSQFNPDNEEWTHYTTTLHNPDNILKTNYLNKIIADDRGNLWIGGLPSEEGEGNEKGLFGLYQFDIQNEEWVNHFYKGESGVNLGSDCINALCADGSTLWVGTFPVTEGWTDGGASFYDGSSWGDLFTTASTDNGLVSNAITAIAVQMSDRGEEVWFGTYSSGLSRYGYGEQHTPADPNTVFRFPGQKGCFTDSFSNMVNQKSLLNHNALGFWWIVLIMSFLCLGIVFFSIVRRYLWVRR